MSNTNTPQDLYDNLNYLNETKSLIRQAITNKGQEIKDEETFRSYAAKISNIQGGGSVREDSYKNIHLYESAEEMVSSEANGIEIGVVYNTSNDSFGGIFTPSTYDASLTIANYIFPAVFNLKTANLSIVNSINTAAGIEDFYNNLDTEQIYFSANYSNISLIYPLKNFVFNIAKANNSMLNQMFGTNDIELGNIPVKIDYEIITNIGDTYRLRGPNAKEYLNNSAISGIPYLALGPYIEAQMYDQLISTYNNVDWKVANNVPHVNYILNSKTLWSPLYTQHNAKATQVFNKGIFYSRYGVEKGTLDSHTEYVEKDIMNVRDVINLYMNTTSGITTGSINDCSNMFMGNEYIITVPNFDTSNVTNMAYMFGGITNLKTQETVACNNLLSVPNFDTSKVNNMCRTFNGCVNLTSVPNFDTSNVAIAIATFSGCTNLTTVPNFNTSKVNNMSFMFRGCEKLEDIPQYNTASTTNLICFADRCNNLSNSAIQNIINMCLNSAINDAKYMNLNSANEYSPIGNTKFDSTYYSNRLDELTAAGWSY